MYELTLLDLECILIDKEKFDVEINEEKIYNVDSDELWGKIHSSEIRVAEVCNNEFVYIKLHNVIDSKEEELIMFF